MLVCDRPSESETSELYIAVITRETIQEQGDGHAEKFTAGMKVTKVVAISLTPPTLQSKASHLR